MKIEKNINEKKTLEHRYIGMRNALIDVSISISDLKSKIKRNTELRLVAFADLESEILNLEFKKSKFELALTILGEYEGATASGAIEIAQGQLQEEASRLAAQQAKIRDLAEMAEKTLDFTVSFDQWQKTRNECKSLFRQIAFILHDDRKHLVSLTETEREHWWAIAEEAKRQHDTDMLNTVLASLQSSEQPSNHPEDDANELRAKIAALTTQIESAQKVVAKLISDPLMSYSDDPEWLAARRAELMHRIRILKIEILALERNLKNFGA